MNYRFDQKPETIFSDTTLTSIEAIKSSEYSVLVGRNNCGKSFILKTLKQKLGMEASYIGPQRYNNFNLLGFYSPNQNKKNEEWNNWLSRWQGSTQNFDDSPLNLQQAIAELNDKQRDKLKEIIKLLLDADLNIFQVVSDNSMSQRYVSCNGHNISYTSSGLRLITTLVTCLLGENYETLLIDEPELGISPEAQGILADFLFDRNHRAKYFSHIKTIVFATHSTIFLDRKNIVNNYMVEKNGDLIDIKPIEPVCN